MDTMMNIEMLFWAARNGGNPYLYDIAVKHAETTMNNHFRQDGTCYHVAVYDLETGKFKRAVRIKVTVIAACGLADNPGLYMDIPLYIEKLKRNASSISPRKLPMHIFPDFRRIISHTGISMTPVEKLLHAMRQQRVLLLRLCLNSAIMSLRRKEKSIEKPQ